MTVTVELDVSQSRVAASGAGAVLCIAGPGTGKTATLTAAVANRIRGGERASEIIVLTFTRRAAAEMRSRLIRTLGAAAAGLSIDTLHGWCMGLVMQHHGLLGFARQPVLVGDAWLDRMREAMKKNYAKGVSKEFIEDALRAEMVRDSLVSYDTLLRHTKKLLAKPAVANAIVVSSLFIDEFQDTTEEQYDIYRAIPAKRRFAVGDPDQAIYGFLGAEPKLMERMAHAGAEVHVLNHTYRCPRIIATACSRLIAKNPITVRREQFTSSEQEGVEARIDTVTIADAICAVNMRDPSARIGVLARTRKELVAIAANVVGSADKVAGHRQTVLSSLVAQRALAYLAMPELKNSRAYARLVADAENVRYSEIEIMATTTGRSLAACLIEKAGLGEWYAGLEGLTLTEKLMVCSARAARDTIGGDDTTNVLAFMAARFDAASASNPSVAAFCSFCAATETDDLMDEADGGGLRIMTVHAAKGLEFDEVYLFGAQAGKWPSPWTKTDVQLEEERRIFFVAMSRARKILHLVLEQGAQPSIFAREAGLV